MVALLILAAVFVVGSIAIFIGMVKVGGRRLAVGGTAVYGAVLGAMGLLAAGTIAVVWLLTHT